ncbi:putative multiple-sugar transport system permease YteP [Clostridia bacterium]|nr:putative multiple-sugar transport system permease YteP [Clostridia bacterium]
MYAQAVSIPRRRSRTWLYIKSHPWLYILMLPGLAYMILFHYVPMYGVVIAFEKFNFVKGIFGSEWIGTVNFRELFSSRQFRTVLTNSLSFSIIRMLWGFPMPLILALLLNEVRNDRFKRFVQSVAYIPHFISWVVVAALVVNLLNPTHAGAVNVFLGFFGVPARNYLTSARHFRSIIVVAEIWKSAGWGTIVYLAALSRVDPQIYEAARIDGANRWQMMRHVTLPSIFSTISVMLILRLGNLMNNGFEQIFLLYSPLVYEVADVFETYTYRIGIQGGRYSYSAAVGLFQSVVGFVLIMSSNHISRKFGENGIL